MEKNAKVFVTGHNGLVGSAIKRKLHETGHSEIITASRDELDLRSQCQVNDFFNEKKPEYVIHAAGKVGGIWVNNNYPAEFIYDNLIMAANVIHSAYNAGVKKLLFLGSSCIYPRMAPQPIREDYFMTGPLEPTNEAYAIAKISGIELCKFYRKQYKVDFISAMPTNLYGINDNFDLKTSHVLPALIRKFHEAKVNNEKKVVIWGTGKPRREFMYVDDLADALIFLMNHYSDEEHINVGTGEDVEIGELASIIKHVVDFKGDIEHDLTKPDGMPRKLLDVNKLHQLGWHHETELHQGIENVYRWYREQKG